MDWSPEAKTSAASTASWPTGDGPTTCWRLWTATTATSENKLGLLLYVDGHVRSYQSRKMTDKQYSTRLKFPVPASMETWVEDRQRAPVFMVMPEPSS